MVPIHQALTMTMTPQGQWAEFSLFSVDTPIKPPGNVMEQNMIFQAKSGCLKKMIREIGGGGGGLTKIHHQSNTG